MWKLNKHTKDNGFWILPLNNKFLKDRSLFFLLPSTDFSNRIFISICWLKRKVKQIFKTHTKETLL